MLPDRHTERLTLLRVHERVVERGAGDAGGPRRDLDPPDLQATHHLAEARTLVPAQEGLGRRGVAVEEHLAALDTLVPELGQRPTDGVAITRFHQEDADPPVRGLGVRVRLAEQRAHARALGVGDPGLGSVDDVPAVDATGDRADRLEIRPTVRFGQGHRGPQLPGGEARQVSSALFIGSEAAQQHGHDRMPAHRTGQAHPAPGELLGHRRETAHRDVHPAELGGYEQPVHAELLHLLDQGFRVGVGVLELRAMGRTSRSTQERTDATISASVSARSGSSTIGPPCRP